MAARKAARQVLEQRKGPLTVVPNNARHQPPLPPTLSRLILTDYQHPRAEAPRVDRAEDDYAAAPFFPGLLQTYAALAYFHDRFGPLADAHVDRDLETRRPKSLIELVLPTERAQAAEGEHTIPIYGDRDRRLLSASRALPARLADLLDPKAREEQIAHLETFQGEDATFTIRARLVPTTVPMPNRRRWQDPYAVGPLPASAKKIQAIEREFTNFGGFYTPAPVRPRFRATTTPMLMPHLQ